MTKECRPVKRGDCLTGGFNEQRPCLWVDCRHHLGVDIAGSEVGGSPSCSLDVADNGALTLDEVSRMLGCTEQDVRHTEISGLVRMRRAAAETARKDGDC